MKTECSQLVNITMRDYLFGIDGEKNAALNQILLELKKYIFYSCPEEISNSAFGEQFIKNVRSLIIKEKRLVKENIAMEIFYNKWKNFVSIYDFRGPDLDFI